MHLLTKMFLINIHILVAHETNNIKLMIFHIITYCFTFVTYSRQICMGIYNGSCYVLTIVNPHTDLPLVFYLLHKEQKHHISHYTPFMCTGGMIVMQHFENVLMSLHLFKKYFINIKFIALWLLNQLVQ